MEHNFILSLDIMWKGMFSIFCVIIIITLLIMIFQWAEKKITAWSERRHPKKAE
ncbi:Oxaloacetate decarboxylase, gamma chain [Anaerocolumna jejuensis DSM 15929]|uniref:Oxaloacetate decarboxylase, gamma chain n=1 Tax=Anaerocolumna jejuensis DSM 15929 TaxID=1121322 RepID=A0A1M7DG20_9FIRM|nr:hypothetical protein [Anaerocolumna jejuensis]SHL78476.1 Oxaloacetate decarboxylase, gamma chain [Anaerocolumna jejuensis DSM 15929]